MTLLGLMLVPLVFAIVVAAAPASRARAAAMAGMLLTLALSVYALAIFPRVGGGFHLEAEYPWLPNLGIVFSLGVDSVSILLVVLTGILGPICVAASTTAITERLKTYYACLLVLQAAMMGVFIARDLILFYVCFEFTLIPMFILISVWGSTNRKRAAIKFFLYTFTGSVLTLAGLVYVAFLHAARVGSWSFAIADLELTAQAMSPSQQGWVMAAMLAGFAVKVPLFPVHTWLPLAHTEAPTAGSVMLAGVLLKLGTYGIYRFVLPFTPVAVSEFAPLLATISIIGIIYGGLICWVQTDIKKLVAYSSVAHLGFCMLGLFALNRTGLQGSVLYMINHGLSTGALFLLIGMIYERYHTRSLRELGGLAAKMPVWATFMVFFTMASVGLPGLNGFISEFLCLTGAFQASSAWGSGLWGTIGETAGATKALAGLGPWYAAIAGVGMIIAAMYLLYMVGKVVWGPLVEPHGHGGGHGEGHGDGHGGGAAHGVLPTDLNRREILTLAPLAVLCIALGVYPKPVMDMLEPSLSRTVSIVEAANNNRATPPAGVQASADSPSSGVTPR